MGAGGRRRLPELDQRLDLRGERVEPSCAPSSLGASGSQPRCLVGGRGLDLGERTFEELVVDMARSVECEQTVEGACRPHHALGGMLAGPLEGGDHVGTLGPKPRERRRLVGAGERRQARVCLVDGAASMPLTHGVRGGVIELGSRERAHALQLKEPDIAWIVVALEQRLAVE
jgi:hypothetical protein